MSFQWHGRDKQGVSKWVGSWDKTLHWLGRIFVSYGSLAGCGGIAGLLYLLVTHRFSEPLNTLVMVGLIHGAVFGGVGTWALKMRRHILSLSSEDKVCQTLGLDARALEQVAEERAIKPRIIINEQPYYDLSDFTEAMSLLRASSAPTQPDTLLRPAAYSETSPDLLLRASESAPKITATTEAEQEKETLRVKLNRRAGH